MDSRMESLGHSLLSCRHRISSFTAPGGGGPLDPPRKAAALPQAAALLQRMAAVRERAALQQRMAATRQRAAASDPALASARSLAERTLSRREQLKGLKDQFRDLEPEAKQALSVRQSKESKHKLTTELTSNTTAMIQQLNTSVGDLRDKRDKRTAAISDQLQALEILEAKSNEDAALLKHAEEAVSWYSKFLGFQIIGGGEGVKLVFNKMDPQCPEKEYSFCIKIDNDRYNLLQCDPSLKELEELVKELNLTGDVVKFVRIIREKFQASSVNGTLPVSLAICPDVSATPISPPVTKPATSRTDDVPKRSHSQSKNNRQFLPAKRRVTAPSAASPGSLRRSPRFEQMRRGVS